MTWTTSVTQGSPFRRPGGPETPIRSLEGVVEPRPAHQRPGPLSQAPRDAVRHYRVSQFHRWKASSGADWKSVE